MLIKISNLGLALVNRMSSHTQTHTWSLKPVFAVSQVSIMFNVLSVVLFSRVCVCVRVRPLFSIKTLQLD